MKRRLTITLTMIATVLTLTAAAPADTCACGGSPNICWKTQAGAWVCPF